MLGATTSPDATGTMDVVCIFAAGTEHVFIVFWFHFKVARRNIQLAKPILCPCTAPTREGEKESLNLISFVMGYFFTKSL